MSGRPVPSGHDDALLRVAQEALANVAKHAGAERADVTVVYAPISVSLEVCDDGAGFDPDAVGRGFGLAGMRVRVAEAGGTLTIDGGPEGGTRVVAVTPVREDS